ncbi:MAG TPA: alkaline phosphatase family protein, partial [Marmoricola sp.]|nr:alkaline phosphatase family protein [Marmoricola sp.]
MSAEFDSQHVKIPEEILRSGLSRRGMLAAMGLMGGTAAVVGSGGLLPSSADASSAYVLPRGFNGDMSDLRHVVIVMQENRSFDQYFGAMPGVRGFGDKQALRFPDGTDVFSQPNGSGPRIRPTHVTTVADSEHGLDHSYDTGTAAWNHGRYNNWVPAKSAATMNHLTGAEIPWQWALASNYTICDNYHCSVLGPTTPNRLYHWTGTSGGVTGNGGETSGTRSWQTYPEALQAAGVSWRVFVDNFGIGDAGIDGYRGDYTDNPIRGFATFTTSGLSLTDFANRSDTAKNAAGTGLIWRAHSTPYTLSNLPDNDSDANLNGVLAEFISSCRPGAAHPLPQVSWV